jgi:hypothetical protein
MRTRSEQALLSALLLVLLTCCASGEDRTQHERPDGGAGRPHAIDSGAQREQGELGEVAPHDFGLWAEVQIEGEWAEYHPTLRDLASSADIAAEVRIVSAEAGRVILGNAAEDVYTEINLNVEIGEVLQSKTSERLVQVSLVLPRAWSLDAQAQSVENANASLPMNNVVMFLRDRGDLPLYRVVNGWGIWAETSRDRLDAPLNPQRIGDGGVYASDLEGVDTVPEFIARVRQRITSS